MKVQPIAHSGANGPAQVTPMSAQNAAKARAVAAFNQATPPQAPTQGQAQETPVANPNRVTAEELSAINAQTSETPDETAQLEATKTPEEVFRAPEPSKEESASAKAFAQLQRQERALRAKAQQQDQAYKAREAALATREAELTAKAQQYSQGYVSIEQVKRDALSVLDQAGVDYNQLTEQVISRQPVDPRLQATIDSLNAKIVQLEKANETSQKTYEEQTKQQYQSALRQIEADAVSLVKSDPEAFEAISKTGTIKEIVKLIEDTYNKDGVLLSVEEAAQEVENYLVEENYKMATSIQKITKRMQQAAQPRASEAKTQAPKQQTQQPMKTLTNATASNRKLSAKERAILAFKGELKG